MKKLLCIFLLLLSVLSYSKGFNVKVGGTFAEQIKNDVSGELNGEDYSDKTDINGSVDYSLEFSYEFQIKENIDLGLGFFIGGGSPMFLSTKYYVDSPDETKGYYIAKLGFALSSAMEEYLDSENESFEEDWSGEFFPYLALGVGLEKNNKSFEISIEGLKGEMEYESGNTDLKDEVLISRLNLLFGYKFDIKKLKDFKFKKDK